MKYLVYDKYKALLEMFENNLIKDYKEFEATIINFLLENDEEIQKDIDKTIDLKILDAKKLLNKLDVEVSNEKIMDYFFENEFEAEYKLLLKEKTKQIINALNLVSFTNINTLSSRIYAFNDKEILSISYYETKEYYENKDKELKEDSFTSFVNNFGKTLERITIEELGYINDCIAIENTSKYPITISLEALKEIKFIRYVILTLERNKINTNNYTRKSSRYLSLIQNVPLYGIKPSYEVLFDNPTELYAQIDFILKSNGLNEKQRALFYKELDIKERNPKINDVKNVHEILEERILLNEVSKYPYEQQDAIYNQAENFKFNDDYYKHIDKYSKDKVYDAVSKVRNSIAYNGNDVESWFNYTNNANKKLLYTLFTNTSKFRITNLFNLDPNILK